MSVAENVGSKEVQIGSQYLSAAKGNGTQFKDSGQRQEFGTGAVRDIQLGKGRFDLVPYGALHQLACVFETGSLKYGDRNWEAGIPISRYLDSASRHLAKAVAGWQDEPHLPMAMWNVACAIQTTIWVKEGRLPGELLDVPFDPKLFPFECIATVSGGDSREH